MATIRHIAITSEDSFVTAELMKRGFGLKEVGRGDSELGREVVLAGVKFYLSSRGWQVASA